MKIIIANWKMNLTQKDSVALAKKIKTQTTKIKNAPELVLCPSFDSLFEVGKALKNSKIKLGAQDMFWARVGAYTGEVSGENLKELGCEYVIIGHSERRQHLKETDAMVNMKFKRALDAGLTPIVCVGETKEQREEKMTETIIVRQINLAMQDVKLDDKQQIIIAYEPVWAIGTGKAVDPSEAEKAHLAIKGALEQKFHHGLVKNNFRIIYGGSVNSWNIKTFLGQKDIDGALVGTASLEEKEFISLIKNI